MQRSLTSLEHYNLIVGWVSDWNPTLTQVFHWDIVSGVNIETMKLRSHIGADGILLFISAY